MRNVSVTPPDFVVCGVPLDDGTVLLYASKELTEAEIKHEVEFPEQIIYGIREPGWQRFEINTTMRNVFIVHARTYAEAFRKLMENWQPPGHESRGRALPPFDSGLQQSPKGLNSGQEK